MKREHGMSSLYSMLGLSPRATRREIKSQFYKLCLLYHPDSQGQADEAQVKWRQGRFIQINDAYRTLSDELKRKAYDQEMGFGRPPGKPPARRPASPTWSPPVNRRPFPFGERGGPTMPWAARVSTAHQWHVWASAQTRKSAEHEVSKDEQIRAEKESRSRWAIVAAILFICYVFKPQSFI